MLVRTPSGAARLGLTNSGWPMAGPCELNGSSVSTARSPNGLPTVTAPRVAPTAYAPLASAGITRLDAASWCGPSRSTLGLNNWNLS